MNGVVSFHFAGLIAIAWDIPRIIGVASIILTAFCLLIAVLACRRPSPVRIKLDLARIVISGTAIALMARITGISTPGAAIAGAIALGVILGSAQGWTGEVQFLDGKFMTRRTVWGVLAWSAGVVVMQSAGIASRTGALKVGQTVSWLGLALLVGMVLGRQQRITEVRAKASATVAAVILGFLIVGLLVAPRAAAVEGVWVLSETRTNPSNALADFVNGVTPTWFGEDRFDGKEEHWSTSPSGFTVTIKDVDYEVVYVDATFTVTVETPPPSLTPGETVTLGASGTASGYFFESNPGQAFEFRADGIYLEGETSFPMGLNPRYYSTPGGSVSPTFMVPPVSDGGEIVIKAFLWNCGSCLIEWVYRAEITEAPVTVPPVAGTTEPASGTVQSSDTAPEVTSQNIDTTSTEPLTTAVTDEEPFTSASPRAGSRAGDPEIPSSSALGAALGGLIAAAAVGLISFVEAGLLADSLVGRGPWSPGDAIAIINRVWEPTNSIGSLTGASSGSTIPTSTGAASASSGAIPNVVTRTIYVSGAEAEAVIRDGPGSGVSIPVDQQWDTNISVPGQPPVTDGRVGSVGVVRSVGPIVRGPDGQVSVGVEVDAFDPPPPPPPPDEPPPPPPPPPPDEPPPDEPPPNVPTPGVVLSDQEIEDAVRWGVERNRSPEDIRNDLEGLNRARGGSGPVELPGSPVQVETDAGPVTVTASEAAEFNRAVAEANRLEQTRADLRTDIAKLDRSAAWWGGVERMSWGRFAAGVHDMAAHSREVGSLTAEIDANIARLNRQPDPMTWDFRRSGMATREEALQSWQNRENYGWHHDQLEGLRDQREALQEQLYQDLKQYSTVDETRVEHLRGALQGIEQGTSTPILEDFALHPDPQEEFAAALQDWRTRGSSGRYFDEAAQLRRAIADQESLIDVPDVEPARPGDRGTVFDRPARELARIAAEQDRAMQDYRGNDQKLDAARRLIDDVTNRGRGH